LAVGVTKITRTALAEIDSKVLSKRQAAEKYNIPLTTLSNNATLNTPKSGGGSKVF